MITSVQYYHLCSLFAHLSREGSAFEKDFVIFYHFFMQIFKFMSETLHIVGPLKLRMKYHWQSVLIKTSWTNNNRVNYSFLLENIDKLSV